RTCSAPDCSEPSHLLGEGPMLGAADDRHIRARAHGLDQAKGRLTAPDRRGQIENAARDVLRERLGRRPPAVAASTDEREIAAGAEEPAGRAGPTPRGGGRAPPQVGAGAEGGEGEPAAANA